MEKHVAAVEEERREGSQPEEGRMENLQAVEMEAHQEVEEAVRMASVEDHQQD